ncbi:hypothetical protein E6Q11_04560 [Candidatus Dojkabacteria bacterium]|uniref:Histidine phosphatase family protein n=1 Tax=Candidatus Dojkabacteria bacterium TaxID=2099670 RepID=A0A5C7J4R8_9BACT|nr:MAG: hypothetical protein E6Q11_04560 [Candidatus Dojkabacteria bacterium]
METLRTAAAIRHARSLFNLERQMDSTNDLRKKFRELFDAEFQDGRGHFSPQTIELAEELSAAHEAKDDPTTPLAPGAEITAELAAKGLSARMGTPTVIYTSPYKRTLDTLDAMTGGWPELTGVRVIKKDLLKEQEHGKVLTLPDWRTLMVLDPEALKVRSTTSEYYYRYPGGESKSDVRIRAGQMLTEAALKNPGKEVIFVTHHVTTLGLCAEVEDWDEEEFLDRDKYNKPENASVTIFRSSNERGGDLALDPKEYGMIFY